MRRVFVDPEAPQRDALDEAAKWIRNGGLVALPTDTLYGLGADPFRPDAVARVFKAKGRDAGNALPVIAADVEQIAARLVVSKPEHEERCRAMGITDFKRVYRSKDLAPGKSIIFAATGVTDGTLMKGVRFFGDGNRTSSVIMQNDPHQIRFIDSIHVATSKDGRIRF